MTLLPRIRVSWLGSDGLLTNKEAFAIVKKHLLCQAKKSYNHDGTDCTYRSAEGLKCAVGVLIPDDEYDPKFEISGYRNLTYVYSHCPTLQDLDFHMLKKLQVIHDRNRLIDFFPLDPAIRELVKAWILDDGEVRRLCPSLNFCMTEEKLNALAE